MMRIAVLAAVWVVAACGAFRPTSSPADGPWRTVPYDQVDPRLAGAAEAACREVGQIDPARAKVMLHDQRGAGVDTVIFGGPNLIGECDTQLHLDGKVRVSGGSSTTLVAAAPPQGPGVTNELGGAMSGTDVIERTVAGGQVGPGVAGVVIVLSDGSAVTASVANGLYSAWWPGKTEAVSVVVLGPDGSPLATLQP